MATFPTNVLYNYFVKIDFRGITVKQIANAKSKKNKKKSTAIVKLRR